MSSLSVSLGECAGEPRSLPTTLELSVRSRRRTQRARRWILNTATGLLAFLVLAFVLPPAFGLSRYTVTDDAMSGTMERGSAVFAKPLSVVDLEVGDVITYPVPTSSGSELVTRRIADIEAGVIWTRGDNTGVLDPWTLTSDQSTQALAVMDVPYAGYVYDSLAGRARLLWGAVSQLG